MTLYEVIQGIVEALRRGSAAFQNMLDRLTEAGMNEEDAKKLLDRLSRQVDNEDDNGEE